MIIKISKTLKPQVFDTGVIHYLMESGSILEVTNDFAKELTHKGYVGYTYKPKKKSKNIKTK